MATATTAAAAALAAATVAATAATAATAASGGGPAIGPGGDMSFLEGRVMLEQHFAKSQQTMEAVRVDLREFLLKNKEGRLPTGGATLPRGGGIPKVGDRLPGRSPVPVANESSVPVANESSVPVADE